MISLSYKARNKSYDLTSFKAQMSTYIDILQNSVNDVIKDVFPFSNTAKSIVENANDYQSIIEGLRDFLQGLRGSTSYIESGATNIGSLDLVSKKFSSRVARTTFSTFSTVKRYLGYYAWWVYSSVDMIIDCIINNGGCTYIELIGPRTEEYLKVLKADTLPKRFGKPYSTSAVPLFTVNPNCNLFGPPMTTRTYRKSDIEKVYEILSFGGVEYYNIGNTTFARPRISIVELQRLNIFQEISSKLGGSLAPDDIYRDFMYDLVLMCLLYYTRNLTFNLDTISVDLAFVDSLENDLPRYMRNLANHDHIGINILIGLIY